MDYITFTDAAKAKDCGRNTLYRAADDGRVNTAEIAGRNLIVKDSAFEQFEPMNKGARAARQTDDE